MAMGATTKDKESTVYALTGTGPFTWKDEDDWEARNLASRIRYHWKSSIVLVASIYVQALVDTINLVSSFENLENIGDISNIGLRFEL
ncbi:hypothetical protein K1719_041773 [Acacia pycnantha]|nr:hypothetical protein K1719_041773 [Acacia pycnantha]